MMNLWDAFCNEESGQGMVEYGLILALIAVVVIIALTALGGSIRDNFNEVNDNLQGNGAGAGQQGP